MTLLQSFVLACACIGGAFVIIAFGVGVAVLIGAAFDRHPALGVMAAAVMTVLPVTLAVWVLSRL